ARGLFDSISNLQNAATMFVEKCITDITDHDQLMRDVVEGSAGLATVFSTVIGYKNATALAVEATRTGPKVTDLAVTKVLLSATQVQQLISDALEVYVYKSGAWVITTPATMKTNPTTCSGWTGFFGADNRPK